jgi:hypothetical protein
LESDEKVLLSGNFDATNLTDQGGAINDFESCPAQTLLLPLADALERQTGEAKVREIRICRGSGRFRSAFSSHIAQFPTMLRLVCSLTAMRWHASGVDPPCANKNLGFTQLADNLLRLVLLERHSKFPSRSKITKILDHLEGGRSMPARW